MTLYIKDPNGSTRNRLILMNAFSKEAVYKSNTHTKQQPFCTPTPRIQRKNHSFNKCSWENWTSDNTRMIFGGSSIFIFTLSFIRFVQVNSHRYIFLYGQYISNTESDILAKFLIQVCRETETLIQINIPITLSARHPLSVTHCQSTDMICPAVHQNSLNEGLAPVLAVFPNEVWEIDWITRTLTSSVN